MNLIKVAVSGGFDPLHIGHLELFRKAKKLGNWLVVIVNNDEFLARKKGYHLMPIEDRIKIVSSLEMVNEAIEAIDKGEGITETLKIIKPNIFANGGDQTYTQEEIDVCKAIGCKIVYGLGDKIRSSTQIIAEARAK